MASGTTITPYSDRQYLFRLLTLIIDGGTEVIRNIFNQRLKSQPLNVFLASERSNVSRLQKQRVITRAQYDLMYPSCGQQPTSSDFDISLILCLLRNLQSLGLNQQYTWNVTPQLKDTTVEADLCRLKAFRNKIAHISSTTGIQQSSFNKEWAEIEQVLLRLNFSSPKPLANFKQTIASYRNSSMDPSAEKRIQTLNMEEIKQDLQNDLILFYKRQHRTIPLSPLMPEDPPLLEFYVMPDIVSVKVTRSRDGNIEEKTPIRTLQAVFYKENNRCKNIYLTAGAGFGKTAFSKKLALAWCHAKKPDKSEDMHFSEDEISNMCGFSYVFLVLLRESSCDCDIDMLILNQICSQLPRDYNLENLREILFEESCLVILDGLDEWTHPLNPCSREKSNIPHQRMRENLTVLTTTRPWKLSVISLHSIQIDHRLELKGISDVSANKLKRSAISHLCREQDKNKLDAYEAEFNDILEEKHKSDLTTIPLFLIYFLVLWYYKQLNVAKSSTDLYKNILELLLSRTVEKDGTFSQRVGNVHVSIPPYFDDSTLFKQFYKLLTSLGELAFQTLFSETKENTLVFDGCVADKYLSKEELTFFLETGVITQSKVQGKGLLENKKVSFAHKTLQEFFAALYINSSPNQRLVQEIVMSKCKCVKDILDMSKIFIFIIGINSKSAFSQELIKIINEDEITQEYRSSLQDRVTFFQHPLKDIQDMYIFCCEEIPGENEVNVTSLCLQDVFIDSRCQQEQYCKNLQKLAARNKQNIRSLYIYMSHMEYTTYDTARKVFDYFELCNLENIETIHYIGNYDDVDILPLLSTSIKCLSLVCDARQQGSWSHLLFDKVTSLHKLEALNVSWFNMRHDELGLLLRYISQRDCMREIELSQLECTDHWSSCTGLILDMSHHSSLRKLTLYRLCLSQVIVNMASLEKCCLRYLCNQDLTLEFSNCAGSKINTFICNNIRSAAVDVVLDTLLLSHQVRQVELTEIDLGTKTLTFSSNFLNLERLELSKVTMEASAFRELVDSLLNLQQTVSVEIRYCTISPAEEFKMVKEKVKTLQNFRIL